MTINKLTLAALFVLGPFLWAQSIVAETLVIPGTGASESILKKIAASYNKHHPEHSVVIPSSVGSGGGINSLLSNDSVLARVARPLNDSEAGQGITYQVFAKDSIVFAVGSKVNVDNLSSTQLIGIFSGKIDNWLNVGANKANIRVLLREADDSSLTIIQNHIEPFRTITFTDKGKVLYHEYEMVDALLKYKRSIGWLAQSSIPAGNQIKPVGIDSLMPSKDNVLSGKYPFVGDYAIIYKETRLTDLARSFLNYLFSDEGKRELVRNGLVPVGRQ